MNLIERRRADKRSAASRDANEAETRRQTALAVSIALKKAEREAAEKEAEPKEPIDG